MLPGVTKVGIARVYAVLAIHPTLVVHARTLQFSWAIHTKNRGGDGRKSRWRGKEKAPDQALYTKSTLTQTPIPLQSAHPIP
jgi:hypothetical protein